MQLLSILSATLLGLAATKVEAHGPPFWAPKGPKCLSDAEALSISTRWLSVFSTGGVTSEAQLATIVSSNIASYDDTFGPPTLGIDQLWESISASGNTTTTNVKQVPSFLIHTCDQIGLRWDYTAVTTGYESTVPAGTKVSFKGTDLLHIDLKTRLIYNATSSGDWILLAQQLGDTCTF